MAKAFQRVPYDMGLERTIAWLGSWFGADDFTVEPVSITCPNLTAIGSDQRDRFDQLRSGNQSELHSFLKLAAWSWLEINSLYPETIASEVTCYEPPKRVEDGPSAFDGLGLEIDIYSAHVIYAHWTGFPVAYGKVVRTDLHSYDYAVEVGATQPVNLLMPLRAGLADRSLWIPYPHAVKTSFINLSLDVLNLLHAYEIRLHQRPATRRYRSPAKNARGPHPYPLNQLALIDWYIRKYGKRASLHAENKGNKMICAFQPEAARNWFVIASQIREALAELREA